MTTTETTTGRRAPAGAAVLRTELTDAIHLAVLEELATHGYGRMSIEGVARRAGVGKTTIYRRWDSKLKMVLDVVSAIAVSGMSPPDTGSLRGDLRAVLGATSMALRHPLALQIIPDLLAEAARNPEIATTLATALRETQLGVSSAVLARAIDRGEIPAGTDVQLALDLAIGPLYWRLAVVRSKLPKRYLDDLADRVTAALTAGPALKPPVTSVATPAVTSVATPAVTPSVASPTALDAGHQPSPGGAP